MLSGPFAFSTSSSSNCLNIPESCYSLFNVSIVGNDDGGKYGSVPLSLVKTDWKCWLNLSASANFSSRGRSGVAAGRVRKKFQKRLGLWLIRLGNVSLKYTCFACFAVFNLSSSVAWNSCDFFLCTFTFLFYVTPQAFYSALDMNYIACYARIGFLWLRLYA